MTASELLQQIHDSEATFQRHVNQWIDDFRRATPEARHHLIADPIEQMGPYEGLVAAIVSALCRETSTETPTWVAQIGSPEPFFAFPARSYALRVRLMIESPAPFRVRNVFVPADYLARA
ncbi:MAG: hypothetical protein WCI05_15585 [Myxococcales bacterium]